jgi:enoyl-CoA hydratase/carnithine racemase
MEAGVSDLVLLEWAGPVAVVSLNRPERANSLTPALLAQLLAALDRAAGRHACRALLLRANGRSFSTGGDLAGFVTSFDQEAGGQAGAVEEYARTIVGLLNEVILAMLELRLPIVAAVHGAVTGGSLGLLLASDVVLVSPAASFTPYYSDVGLSPDGGWTALLPRVIGRQRAATTLLLNETISAELAVAWGLASRLVSPEALDDEALRLAHQLAAKKAGSVGHSRRLLLGRRDELAAALAAELERFVAQVTTAEAQAGCRDFLAQLAQRKGGR